jgi:hypothetical protein
VILLPSLWSLPRVAKMFSGDISDVVHGVCAKKNAQNLTAVVQYFRDNLPRNRAFSTAVNLHSL